MKKTTGAKSAPKQNTKPIQIGCIYVPYYDEVTTKTVKHSSLSWITLSASLLTRYEFATSSPQSRGVFVSLLLLCCSSGSAKLPMDIKYLSNLLSCDQRTLKKSLDELEKNSLVQKESFEAVSLISVTERQNAKDEVSRKAKKKARGEPTFCERCKNSGKIKGQGDQEFDCPHCFDSFQL